MLALGILAICGSAAGCAAGAPTAPSSPVESTTAAPDASAVPGVPVEDDPPTGTAFEVAISYDVSSNPDGSISILAESNLPDGAELMVSIYSDDYHAQDTQFLDGAAATFGPFSDKGNAMAAGTYDMSISMSIASLQSDIVRRYIGDEGELMTGTLVQSDSTGGRWVDLHGILTIS